MVDADTLGSFEALERFRELAEHAVRLGKVAVSVVEGALCQRFGALFVSVTVDRQQEFAMMNALDIVIAQQVHIAEVLVTVAN